jgi:hypothetical protein
MSRGAINNSNSGLNDEITNEIPLEHRGPMICLLSGRVLSSFSKTGLIRPRNMFFEIHSVGEFPGQADDSYTEQFRPRIVQNEDLPADSHPTLCHFRFALCGHDLLLQTR